MLRAEIAGAIGWMGAHEQMNTSLSKRLTELRRFLAQLDGESVLLGDLAKESGGEFFLPPNYEDLIASPARLHREIGAQYSLAFVTERDPSFDETHEVRVLPARRGLSVRARRTYYSATRGLN